MSNHDDFDEEASRRTFTAPYTPKHPVPTVQGYRQSVKAERESESDKTQIPHSTDHTGTPSPTQSKRKSIISSAKNFLHIENTSKDSVVNDQAPYNARNRNIKQPQSEAANQKHGWEDATKEEEDEGEDRSPHDSDDLEEDGIQDTSEAVDGEQDPRQKRKNMKHLKRDHKSRKITDPVTHLPVLVHDSSSKELKSVPENEPPAGSQPRTSTGVSNKTKAPSQLDKETEEQQAEHRGMEKLFPPPQFDSVREELATIYSTATLAGLGAVLVPLLLLLAGTHIRSSVKYTNYSWYGLALSTTALLSVGLGIGGGTIWAVQGWLKNRTRSIWDDELWDAARLQERGTADSPMPESTQWLNSLLASVWPLVNPDLFTSLVDTLEDVMQASLPKMVRMISVEDLGQGSESIRILGVRWLPTGAAARKVSLDGKIQDEAEQNNDREVPGEGQVDREDQPNDQANNAEDTTDSINETENEEDDAASDENVAAGMEAEEGDFVNIEVAFSYRASKSGNSLAIKSKNAHLYLAFYLPGGIRFPVWVEVRGIVGTMRMRLQLCPDPPFFALCTLTLLGQPKADLSCIPLTKKGLNIMDLPLISSFVQSSIDAALAEYVAPKSLTLDLKDMLVGDDFKKDTTAKGVVVVKIKRGRDFKYGDPGFLGLKPGSSDAYVAVGWAKFGKPVWSTRVIVDDMEPIWDETTFILVGPEELNAEERLRVQLWDSDRVSADDDLGRIEVDLKELMHSPRSLGKMWDRTDGFQALEGSDTLPGTLDWSVGYFPKTRIQPEQLKLQKLEEGVKTMQDLKDKVSEDAERKLREAKADESHEIDQQKAQDLKIREDAMIAATPPLEDYPTGMFSIVIHQITGVEFEKVNKAGGEGDEGDETQEGNNDLPSSYCTVILNHQTVFKTRTKPKNAKPFFNAGTERLVRDWQSTEVIISVRDSRVHENDPLLGIVYLPLGKIFKERSQIIDSYPLVGGIGYGRARISMVFRSIQLQVPRELLGWDYGTLEITSPITSTDIAPDLKGLRIKVRTVVNRGKMYHSRTETENTQWKGKHDRPVRLAVKKRYSSCVIFEFRKNTLGKDKTPAFAVLWLKDVPDEQNLDKRLTVWKADGDHLKRAEANCIDSFGEAMGTLSVSCKFIRGLGAHHKRLASKSPNLQDVFEVLETAQDNREIHVGIDEDDEDDDDDSSVASDEADGDGKVEHPKIDGILNNIGMGSESKAESKEKPNDGTGGPVQQIQDYKINSDQLHRRHRGLMQFKGARTATWMKTKVEHGKNHVLDNFKHHERDPGIETEV